jgi:hypothetical protein
MAKPYTDTASLANRLQTAREKKCLSYAALGRLSGVDAAQAFRVCRGEFRTLSHNVMKICNALDVGPFTDDARSREPVGGQDSKRLVNELMATWDHTAAGADRLLRLLTAIRQIQEGGKFGS